MISFLCSGTKKDHYPESEREVAFVGRSNVGKSSLINKLYGKIAYVGKTPGKTRLLNFFNVDNKYTVCDNYPYVMSGYQTSAAYMLRGAGIPPVEMVDELTSSIDIYQVMAKLHGFEAPKYTDGNLPAALGGKEREYTISNSIYPGQTYKLCIRTAQYEFQLESKEFVDTDGTVDLTDASMYILDRGFEWKQCYNLNLLKYFMDIAREHTKSFCTWGRNWPKMRQGRPKWFGGDRAGKEE